MLPTMVLKARGRAVAFPRRPLVMGIVNITEDSFSGDGSLDVDLAIEKSASLIRDGADIIDVGGESARTNRAPVEATIEVDRVGPFVARFEEALREARPRDESQLWPPLLSVNTWRPEVAGPLLREGVDILNDIGGLPTSENARICAETGTALVVMHTVGAPKIPHTEVRYRDVMEELDRFFVEKMGEAASAGLDAERLILDPGIDFAKQREDNLTIYRELPRLLLHGRPILLPVSRKTVIGEVLGIEKPEARDAGTMACAVLGSLHGAAILRVHNVSATWECLKVLEAVEQSAAS